LTEENFDQLQVEIERETVLAVEEFDQYLDVNLVDGNAISLTNIVRVIDQTEIAAATQADNQADLNDAFDLVEASANVVEGDIPNLENE